MAVMTFAAIDIGSYEVSMKIFEMSKRIGFRELNDVRYSLEIGKGVYSDGKIDSEMLNVLCEVLNDFKRLMQDFGVEEYRACGTSAFRELVNPLLIIEQIYQRTGMKIEILSSAEQHFLGYKSIAAIEKGFKKMIQKGTAILDVGGGSLQVSLFDKDALVTTQGLKMGSLRIRQRLQELEKTTIHYDKLVEEFIRNDLMSFQRLYLKDKDIRNVILMGDFITDMIFQEEMEDRIITREEFWLCLPWLYAKILLIFSMQSLFGHQVFPCWMELPMILQRRKNFSKVSTILRMTFWLHQRTLRNAIPAVRAISREL